MPSSFYALTNLTHLSVTPSLPWDFTPTITVPDEVRANKDKRQDFHKDKATTWNYYSPFEGANPNQRVSKSNPPRLLHGFAPEWDMQIPPVRVDEEIARAKIKPAYIERSLGNNLRLVYAFPRPLPVDSLEFAIFLLGKAEKWLGCQNLPGFDEKAFVDPTRFLANGANWAPTGHGPIPEDALQAFFVEVGNAFRRPSEAGVAIPLEEVERALKEKYPTFNWPGPFELESQGPSFWIADSTSPKSAILKPDGFFTFSAHADKPFYSWADLLGADFTAAFERAAISKATLDIFFDGKKFWRKKKGVFTAMETAELVNHFEIGCGMKGPKIKQTLNHIYSEQCVESAGPYVFQPPGLLIYQGKRRLNTADVQVLQPATGEQSWGDGGNFPFLSSLLDNLFTTEIQRDKFLAWWQYLYQCGLNMDPQPGQVLFLMGGVATGKTFTSREVVGRSVGGYVDASGYLTKSSDFNSHLFESALWVSDDDAVSDSPQAAMNIQMALKKAVANSSHLSNKKFQTAGMVEWCGRIIITTNLDYLSSRLLGPLDNSSLDKISVFRCVTKSRLRFPSRPEMQRLLSTELPFLLRWLVDHTPPEHVEPDVRFGVRAHHDESLMEQASQTSKSEPFRELLVAALLEYFESHPNATEWRGPATELLTQIHMNPARESIIRTLRIETTARYLENIAREGMLGCRTETGDHSIRHWIFPRL